MGQLKFGVPVPTRCPRRRAAQSPPFGPNSSRRLFRVFGTQMLPLSGLNPTPWAQLNAAEVSETPLSPHMIGLDPFTSKRWIRWLTVSVTNT